MISNGGFNENKLVWQVVSGINCMLNLLKSITNVVSKLILSSCLN